MVNREGPNLEVSKKMHHGQNINPPFTNSANCNTVTGFEKSGSIALAVIKLTRKLGKHISLL